LLGQPAWLIRAALGEQAADETVLGSLRIEPKRLLETGFRYRCAALPKELSELDGAS
jgi:NAD dependent epimerase/dehydratase family enzyme